MAADVSEGSTVIVGVDSRCLLFLCALLSFHTLFGEAIKVKVAVPSAAFYDLAQAIKSEMVTSNTFQFKALPSQSGEDEMSERDSLYDFLERRKMKIMLGSYRRSVAVVTEKLEIPFVVTTFDILIPEENVLQVVPAYNDIVSCVLDVIEAYRWKQVGLFCDEEILHPRLLSEMVRNPAIDLRLWHVPHGPVNRTRIKEDLMTLRGLRFSEVVLLTPDATSKIILETARDLGIFAKPYSWMMLNMGSERYLEPLMTDLSTNVTTINLVLPSPNGSTSGPGYNTSYSLIDTAILSDSMMLMDYLADPKWQMTQKQLTNVYQGRTGNVQFGENGLRNNFSFAVFNSEADEMKQIGEWWKVGDKHRFLVFPRVGKIDLDRNDNSLNGKSIKVVSILEKPWLMQLEEPDLNGNMYEGYSFDLLNELSRVLNFKYDMYLVPDGKYGVLDPSGKWDGMVGELVTKHASICIAPLAIDANREAAIDFTVPFMHRGITVLIRSPEIQRSFFKFMRPLSFTVWIAVLAAIILFSVLLCIVERGGRSWRSDLPRLDNIVESWWFILGAIACGNSESSPVTISGRVLSSAWWFFSLILISTYTANLAAFLTVKIIHPPISGVDDLLGQNQIKYGTVRNTEVELFFRNTAIMPYSQLNTHMALMDSNVNSTEEGLLKVLEGNYALLWDASVNTYTASTDCNFTNVGPAFDIRGFGLGLPQGTLFKDELSLALLKIADEGTLTELEHKWWGRSRCLDLSRPSVTPSSSPAIQTENVAGMFFILAGGVLLACIGLICEKVHAYVVLKKNQ